MAEKWRPDSWRGMPIRQVPEYPDAGGAGGGRGDACATIRRWSSPARRGGSRRALAEVAEGKAFLLQGGDCAESFAEFHPNNIRDTFRVLLQMAVVLTFGAACPVVKVGRMAGPVRQAALRRHRDPERRDAAVLSRRHHQRHGVHADGAHARSAAHGAGLSASRRRRSTCCAPSRRAAMPTCTASIAGTRASSPTSPAGERYRELADRLTETLDFMAACGLTSETTPQIRETDFFTSHEALLLPYEQALTRVDSTTGDWYDVLGAHAVDRRPHAPARRRACRVPARRQESARPQMRADASTPTICCADRHAQSRERAGPADADRAHGRRQGREQAAAADPRRGARGPQGGLVLRSDARQHHDVRRPATRRARSTRSWPRCSGFFAVHEAEGTYAGGVHFEMTGQDVTECIGGAQAITETGLGRPLPHPLRSAPQRQPGAGARLPDRRGAEATARRRQRSRPRGGGRRSEATGRAMTGTTIAAPHRHLFPAHQGDRRAASATARRPMPCSCAGR